eukprot:9161575-Pyramimonas_sp.AAC.1
MPNSPSDLLGADKWTRKAKRCTPMVSNLADDLNRQRIREISGNEVEQTLAASRGANALREPKLLHKRF